MLINLLSHLTSVTTPLSFGQRFGQNMTGAGKRRKKVRNMLTTDISEPLLARIKSSPPPAPETSDAPDADNNPNPNKKIKKPTTAVHTQTLISAESATKKQLIHLRKTSPHLDRVARAHELSCMVLSQLTTTPTATFIDLVNGNPTSTTAGVKSARTTTTVLDRDSYAKLKLRQTQRTANLLDDVAFSSDRLRNMVTKTESPVTPVSPAPVVVQDLDQTRMLIEGAKLVDVVVQEERVLVPELVEI